MLSFLVGLRGGMLLAGSFPWGCWCRGGDITFCQLKMCVDPKKLCAVSRGPGCVVAAWGLRSLAAPAVLPACWSVVYLDLTRGGGGPFPGWRASWMMRTRGVEG